MQIKVVQLRIMEVANQINWNSPKNQVVNGKIVIPTIVISDKEVLGLAYSTQESLKLAIEKRAGIYYSRTRDSIWIKGEHMRNRQVLLKVKWDCDSDALLFVVKQRGEFCHVKGCNSCFSKEVSITEDSPVRLSYATGYCESISFRFLKQLGINVFGTLDRSRAFLAESDLAKFSLQGWKPKDIGISIEHSDMILYYKELMGDEFLRTIDTEFITLGLKSFSPVKICLVGLPGIKKTRGMKIATEYPTLAKSGEYNYITTHGNSEEYVKKGFCDAAIVAVVSGKTLKDMGLAIIETLIETDMRLMISKKYYRAHPRVCREIRNVIENDYIYFYSVDGPYGVFSNFYPCKFIDEKGLEWKSSEHYYQAHKFTDPRLFEMIRNTKTCKECYKLAWTYEKEFRSDWSEVKDEIMVKALRFKFYQNAEFANALKETKKKILVEHSMNDLHYGSGLEGNGKNRLGSLLMLIRDEIQSKL